MSRWSTSVSRVQSWVMFNPNQPTLPTSPGKALIGTVRYMAPEQARGESVGSASDVFSLGIVFYELITGQHPFQTDSQLGVLQAIASHSPLSPESLNPEVPGPLASLIQQMLQKDARLRPTSAEVANVLTELCASSPERLATSIVSAVQRHTVGRQKELAELSWALESAGGGKAQFVCVTGEPGIGKTTLIEDFLSELPATGRECTIGRGRCSERLAGTEAYLPILEALESMLRGDSGETAARIMKTVAPNWFVQVAPLATEDSSVARKLAEVKAASQERLKRELVAFLQEVSRLRPLLLFLDDVHWADVSTIDLLAYLGSRCDGLQIVLVLAYRPTDLALSQHPFGPLKLELQTRGVCREVALEFLSRADIERYLAPRVPRTRLPTRVREFGSRANRGEPLVHGRLAAISA